MLDYIELLLLLTLLYVVCSLFVCLLFFFFKQKTAYEMRISDWSSDVCSSDLGSRLEGRGVSPLTPPPLPAARGPASAPAPWAAARRQIGRASCRERVCQYV